MFSLYYFQIWSLNLSANSVKMKMVPLSTTTLQMDAGMAIMGMGLVLMETMDMERIPMDIMAMAIIIMEKMDMETGMVMVTKRRSKITDAPTAEAVETLSLCPSVLILFLLRSLLKTHPVLLSLTVFSVVIVITDGTEFNPKLMHFYVVFLLLGGGR